MNADPGNFQDFFRWGNWENTRFPADKQRAVQMQE